MRVNHRPPWAALATFYDYLKGPPKKGRPVWALMKAGEILR